MSHSPRRLILSLLAVAALCAPAAQAAPLPTRPVLTLQAARTVVAAAQSKAKAEGWPAVIAVVDSGGLLILLERMDDAPLLAGVELAAGKARTAALFRKPSGALEDSVNGGRTALLSARGFILMRGAVPISVNGQVVGAIGVSGDTPEHDEVTAKAGAAAIAP